MRKTLLFCMVLILFCAGQAAAQGGAPAGTYLDVGVGFGTEPAGNFGNTFGLGIGATQDFLGLFKSARANKFTSNLLLRTDISYFKWDDTVSVFGVSADIEYRRVPLFVGGRYVIPKKIANKVIMYGEGGLEISFDKIETAVCVPGFPPFTSSVCTKGSETETNVGVSPGFGLIMPINDSIVAGLDLRYHIISDSYLTGLLTIGFKIH